jgi:hypothetical protein
MLDLLIGGNPQGTRALLADSLAVWRVRGAVQAGEPPAVAVIHAEDGTVVRVERASESERPVRWWVRWHGLNAAAQGAGATRSRPCTSAVGLLRAVREALGAEGGRRLRIGPSAGEM